MNIPRLKRVKISSAQELRDWLARNTGRNTGRNIGRKQEVMIVTCNEKSRDKHVSRDQLRAALGAYGWVAGRSYTLDGNLVGHVVSRG